MATAAVGFGTGELIIDAPGSASMRVPLERDRYRLGRSSANELAFPADQRLSREHLVFERTGKGWNVRDNGSRNGTQVNGKRLTQTTPLVHGDQITAGNLSIRYEMSREFADARVDGITFFEQSLANPTPAVSVTLKSALQVATDPVSHPTLENAHLGALVRAGRELAGHGALEELFELVLDLSLSAVKASRGVVMTRECAGDLDRKSVV